MSQIDATSQDASPPAPEREVERYSASEARGRGIEGVALMVIGVLALVAGALLHFNADDAAPTGSQAAGEVTIVEGRVEFHESTGTGPTGLALGLITLGCCALVSGALMKFMSSTLVAIALLMAVAWQFTFVEMWHRWFPAIRFNLPFPDWITEGSSYYTHAIMVPFISLFIAWQIHKRVGLPRERTTRATLVGLALLIPCLLFHLISMYARVMFVSGFAMIGVIGGIVLLIGGFKLARAYWLPVVLLVFMVPLPMDLIANINLELKSLASTSAVWTVNRIFRVAVYQQGSFVHLVSEPGAPAKQLIVENVCGGLRSLISLICFASLFALVCRIKGFWRWVLLVLALPLAILCNVIRITTLILVAHYFSVEAAGEESWFHGFSGMAVFAVALGLLFGFGRIVVFVGEKLKRDWTDDRLMGYLDAIKPDRTRMKQTWRPGLVSAMVVVTAISFVWSRQETTITQSDVAARSVPAQLTIDGELFTSRDIEMPENELIILETKDYLYREYTGTKTDRQFFFCIIFSENNRKGTHPPDVCLDGTGQEIFDRELRPLDIAGVGTIDMRKLMVQNAYYTSVFYYTYKCGDNYTPSYLSQQFQIFLNGMVSRNAAGALIRFHAVLDEPGDTEAEALNVAAANVIMPILDETLP